jgi:hypothetical protein
MPFNPETRMIEEVDIGVSSTFDLSTGRKPTQRDHSPNERIALETINKLIVTVSHYLSNPLPILLLKVESLSETTENRVPSLSRIQTS